MKHIAFTYRVLMFVPLWLVVRYGFVQCRVGVMTWIQPKNRFVGTLFTLINKPNQWLLGK